jgi:hypothetical protein
MSKFTIYILILKGDECFEKIFLSQEKLDIYKNEKTTQLKNRLKVWEAYTFKAEMESDLYNTMTLLLDNEPPYDYYNIMMNFFDKKSDGYLHKYGTICAHQLDKLKEEEAKNILEKLSKMKKVY